MAKSTSKDKEEVAPERGPARPIRVDQSTRRSDKDGLEGGFVKGVPGSDHELLVGVFESVATYDATTGYPSTINVRFVDAAGNYELATVIYANVVPRDYIDPATLQAAAAEVESRVVQPDAPAEE
jgi:hypothetical protein